MILNGRADAHLDCLFGLRGTPATSKMAIRDPTNDNKSSMDEKSDWAEDSNSFLVDDGKQRNATENIINDLRLGILKVLNNAKFSSNVTINVFRSDNDF